MKKALLILAMLVAVALIWEQIPTAREVTVDDYATDQHGSYLARWGVYYYEVIGTDTTLIDMDTTDAYGWYEITAPTGSYLIYAFPLWDDSTDTSLSRKSFMNKQTIVAVANDTTFFRFVVADSGFGGAVTFDGEISFADTAAGAMDTSTANPIVYTCFPWEGCTESGGVYTDSLGEPYLHIRGPVYISGYILYDGAKGLRAVGPKPIGMGDGGIGIDADTYWDTTGIHLTIDDSLKFGTGPSITASATELITDTKITGPGFTIGDGDSTLIIEASGDDIRSIFTKITGENTEGIVSLIRPTGGGTAFAGQFTAAVIDTMTGEVRAVRGYVDFAGGVGVPEPSKMVAGHFEATDGTTAVAVYARAYSGINYSLAGLFSGDLVMGDTDGIATYLSNKRGIYNIYADSGFMVVDTAVAAKSWIGSGVVDDTLAAHKTDIANINAAQAVQDDSLTAHKTDIATINTAQGVQDDTLSAHKTDIANINTAQSVQDDSLTAHKTDIAALQATKVDTNKAYVYRSKHQVSDRWASGTTQWGTSAAPSFWEADTVSITRCFVSANATGTDPWKFVWVSCTGDTLAKHTSTTSGHWNWDTTMTATILPTGGVWTVWEEVSGATNQGSTNQGFDYYFFNP